MSITCPVCQSTITRRAVAIRDMPVYCNILSKSDAAASNVKKGDLLIDYCVNCSHLFNSAFDPALMDYSQEYENSLHYSPKFNEYAETLAGRLIEKYGIKYKTVIEIGCGKGDFLSLLCAKGNNKGYGFDKSFEAGRSNEHGYENIEFIQDFYDEKYSSFDVDLFCCRHVLEHIPDPVTFLAGIKKSIKYHDKAVVYFEVPNALYTIKDMGIWDLIYEHCGYFTSHSLKKVFKLAGFDIIDSGESFGGQFLFIEARIMNASSDNIEDAVPSSEISGLVNKFTENYEKKIRFWRQRLEEMKANKSRAVIWGGGSKGVTFMNALQVLDEIGYVVDLNPNKHNQFIPGTGQMVIPPESLAQYNPDFVIVMNPIYAEEIRSQLKDMELSADVLIV